jgi:mannose-6-phosphate isomerase-like protein (cupin superfamily)
MSLFPGGVSVSHLRVYDWPAPDGVGAVGSGSPHLHVASSEAYLVLAGTGAVHTLGPTGFHEHRVGPGSVVRFDAGIVHRAVNDGDLEALVVMSNAGLPEAGDAVMTFPRAVLADPAAYRAAATLPGPGTPDDELAAAARRRRDLAVEGYRELLDEVGRVGPAVAMRALHDAAVRLVRPTVPHWQDRWTRTVLAETDASALLLEGLARGVVPGFGAARVAASQAEPGARRYGMCGRLRVWPSA